MLSATIDAAGDRALSFHVEIAESHLLPEEAGWTQAPSLISVDTGWTAGSWATADEPVDSLLAKGFVRPLFPDVEYAYEYQFIPLTPDVLLSPAFHRTHCFFFVAPGDQRTVGLGFQPIDEAVEHDVEGIVWFTRPMGQITIDYRYTRYPHEDNLWFTGGPAQGNTYAYRLDLGDRVGGRLTLILEPTVGWVVSALESRVPDVSRKPLSIPVSAHRDQLRRGEFPEGCCNSTTSQEWWMFAVRAISVRVISVRVGR